MRAGADRTDEFRMPDGGDVAVALKGELFGVHRSGDIDGDDEFEVDLRLGGGGRAAASASQAATTDYPEQSSHDAVTPFFGVPHLG